MLPNGPKNPSVWQRLIFFLHPLETLEQWSKQYGDNFRLLGNKYPPAICFTTPEAIKKIFTAPANQVCSTQKDGVLKTFVGSNSIIYLEPQAHNRTRRLLMPVFHSCKDYGQLITHITEQVMSQFKTGDVFLIRPVLKNLTLQVLLNVVFGTGENPIKAKLFTLLTSLVTLFDSPFSFTLAWPFFQQDWLGGIWKEFKDIQNEINELIYSEIAKRRLDQNKEEKDVLNLLMAAHDENGQPLSEAELRDQIMTMVFAGFETTAAALTWALYWVHYLTEVEDKLRNEINANCDLEPNGIAKLPYLNAIVSETLRIYPIAINGFFRTVLEPLEIAGYSIPKETIAYISIYLAHHRESVYPEPEKFKPERFLERQFSPYEFLPFGGGDRLCLGWALAQYEIKLALVTILKTMKLELTEQKLLKPVRHGVAMIPPKDLKMRLLQKYVDNKI